MVGALNRKLTVCVFLLVCEYNRVGGVSVMFRCVSEAFRCVSEAFRRRFGNEGRDLSLNQQFSRLNEFANSRLPLAESLDIL